MMTITVFKVLFAPIIIIVRFRIFTKITKNKFNNYSISLLEFYIECVMKLVCEKKRKETYEEEVSNSCDEQYMIWCIYK